MEDEGCGRPPAGLEDLPMTLETSARKAAELFKQKLEAEIGVQLEALVVFGSRARDDWRPGSDLDILVLVQRRDLLLDRRIIDLACEVEAELQLKFPLAPRIMTRQHYQHLLQRERKLAQDIEAQGIPL